MQSWVTVEVVDCQIQNNLIQNLHYCWELVAEEEVDENGQDDGEGLEQRVVKVDLGLF